MSTLDGAMNYLADDRLQYKTVNVKTGSTLFSDYYYNDYTYSSAIGSGNVLLGAFVIGAGSNRPGFVMVVSNSVLRVYSNYANITFNVRLVYRQA